MDVTKQYAIAWKGLKNGTYRFDFKVDNALFEAYGSTDIKAVSYTHLDVYKRQVQKQTFMFDYAETEYLRRQPKIRISEGNVKFI